MSSVRRPGRFQGTLLTRRHLQVALGLLWLFDGVLQGQPPHFTASFFGSMLRMGTAEPPGWLWDLGSRIEPLLTAQPAVANAIFTALEIAIGAALLWRRTARVALAVSIPFALGVWLFGEAAGGLFGPGASALTGAPGAALVYAAVAVLLWPRDGRRLHKVRAVGPSSQNDVPAREELGGPVLDLVWVALWLGTAALESETLNRLPIAASSAIYNA
ncbi:MAG: hypothetical protein JWM85_1254, partial [Acidimicrobiaceae bacterium]|nr:hypothetical protein [Acidimicrobiaceae bacterium]